MASMHDWNKKPTADDEEDPVENMIKKTGCIEHHYKVLVRIVCFSKIVKVTVVPK